MAVPLVGMSALIKALGPAFKIFMAKEAMDVVRKYMFDSRTKGGRQFNQQMWNTISTELDNMKEGDWKKLLKNSGQSSYKKKAGEWIKELVPSAIGTAAGAAGSAYNMGTSIMANALANSVDNMVAPGLAAKYGNPYKKGAALFTGAKMARGGVADILGNAAGGWFNNLSRQIQNENLQNRISRMMLENNMTGEALKTLRWANGTAMGNGYSGGRRPSPR